MLEKIYHNKAIIHELRQGIFGKYIDGFSVYLQELRYSKKNRVGRFTIVRSFSQWLTKKKVVWLI